jgi:hypothetical protein
VSHVEEHCGTPKITRHWKRLGEGATWTCSCGRQYRLTWAGGYGCESWQTWKEVK